MTQGNHRSGHTKVFGKSEKPAGDRINWFTAPPVPPHVIQRRAQGLDIGGTIVDGPFGQQTFVSHTAKSA